MPRIRTLLTLALAVALVGSLAVNVSATPSVGHGGGRKIVLLKAGADRPAVAARLRAAGGLEVRDLRIAGAFALRAPDRATVARLLRDPAVALVENDVQVRASAPKNRVPAQPAEVLQPGVDLIDADLVWPSTKGATVKVAVLDTGIDGSHPDLAANFKGGVSTVGYTRKSTDDNGHGTHVAGIIAAADNEIGVVGVAPEAGLYAVKVLDRQGNGYTSDIMEGLQWAIDNGIDVVNMSFGSDYYSSGMDSAVQAAAGAGVVCVAAAGNDGPGDESIDYPGRLASVIAVGATDVNDAVPYWSSRGAGVDVAAPGVGVYSTYKGGKYAWMSGTSMATPHVAGTVALMLTQPVGAFDAGDGNGQWDPAEVEAKLRATALDVDLNGFDPAYGFGRIQADEAAGTTAP